MRSSFKIRYASQTDVGIRRSHNQDACACQPATDEIVWQRQGHVFVVADGMGGHAVGEKASAKAVRDIPLTYSKHASPETTLAAIRRSFVEANAGIHQIGLINPEFKGLGTTGSALILRPEGAWVGHVGDSRVYRIRGDRVQQLTFDHSWVWEMARRQGIDPDELGDVRRNVIIRSLGPEAEVEVDVEGPHPLEPGDTFLICSDGLTNHVKADEIGTALIIMPPQEACSFLIDLANLRGGSDNITCLVVQVGPDDTADSARPTRQKNRLASSLKWWGRRVTWPLTGVLFGGALVAISIGLKLERLTGAASVFALAAMVMLVSLGAFAMQLRRKVEGGATDDEEPPMIRIYKEHRFRLDHAAYERIVEEEAAARTIAEELGVSVDWSLHASLVRQAESTLSNDWKAAILARCQALHLIAAPVNKSQHKNESFRPNWTTKSPGMGG